jgi:MFS family permease
VSILSAGTFFGALLAFPMADIVGRKWGIIASCGVFCLGVGLQLDTHWAAFVVGRGMFNEASLTSITYLRYQSLPASAWYATNRAILPLGTNDGSNQGLVSCLIPMYQSEVCTSLHTFSI